MVNTVGKGCFEADRAYLAGFLDADGAIMAVIEKHLEKKFGFRVRVILKITQRDKKSLAWFKKTFDVGQIKPNRTTYEWLVRNQQEVVEIINLVFPYLKVKKKQAAIARDILSREVNSWQELIIIARMADSLAKLNVRSKNRRKVTAQVVEEHFSRND